MKRFIPDNFSFSESQRALLAHLAVLLIIALPLFGHLDEHPLRVWDEMRNAVSALEMSQGGSPIVTTVEGRPEIWSTKPPLLIWIQAIFLKILGPGELAVRLPSAIAAALLCFAVLRFMKRRTGRWLPGLLAVVVLVSSEGFVGYHAARYGDYDALLTLFVALYAFCFFNFIEDEKPRWLLFSALCLTAAALTKGVAALFILPALLVYALLRKKGRILFFSKAFYAGLALFVLIVGGYYLLRDVQQPGYLQLVMKNELGGRYQTSLETHSGDAWFYFDDLHTRGMPHWFWLLLAAVPAGLLSKKEMPRRLTLFSLLCALSCLLAISFAATKLWWYAVPCYPFLAMLISIFLTDFLTVLKSWEAPAQVWRFNFLPAVVFLLLALPAYTDIYDMAINGHADHGDAYEYNGSLYLKQTLEGKQENKANVLCGDAYPLTWYRMLLAMRGHPLPAVQLDSLKPGMRVMAWQNGIGDYINSRFESDTLTSWRSVQVYLIKARKPEGRAEN